MPCPTCGLQQREEYLRGICGLVGPELAKTVKSTHRTSDIAGSLDFIEARIASPSFWLTLYGEPGVGKTHLLIVAINAGRAAGRRSIYTTATRLLDEVKRTFNNGGPDGVLDKYRSADILAVDELDNYNKTEWAETLIIELLNYRYREIDTQFTLLAMNQAPELALPAMMSSRSKDGRSQIVHLRGRDVRPLLQPDFAGGVK